MTSMLRKPVTAADIYDTVRLMMMTQTRFGHCRSGGSGAVQATRIIKVSTAIH